MGDHRERRSKNGRNQEARIKLLSDDFYPPPHPIERGSNPPAGELTYNEGVKLILPPTYSNAYLFEGEAHIECGIGD